MSINPITRTDYPDPDIIRVDDVYYMISTTMYYMPGGVILRSYDLINWEIATYVFDSLDNTNSERLIDGNNYGKGMWAATLRYHNGRFYVAFVSHGRKDTHLFISENIEGPWEHRLINEYFHDCSLLFDDDGRVFIVSGNTDIRLTELTSDLTSIKPDGIDKIIIRDNRDEVFLGYEGAHFYKINGKYIITLIHWPKYNRIRTEAVFICDTVDGEYIGKDVLADDCGLTERGVAQGGLVDTLDGKWYSICFQDMGAVGRVPYLIPVAFDSNDGFPVFGIDGKIPMDISTETTRPFYTYEPLFTSDDFSYDCNTTHPVLKKQWQWNHVQDNACWAISDKKLSVTTNKISINPLHAQNTLTQRMAYPSCSGSITVDASLLNNGDYVGLAAMQGCFGFIGINRADDKFYLTKLLRTSTEHLMEIGYTDNEPGEITERIEIKSARMELKLHADFTDMRDLLDFYYREPGDEEWKKLGDPHQMIFGLDHFTGVRFGLCVFSSEVTGGTGVFENFLYEY